MTDKKHELSMRKSLPIDKARVLKILKMKSMTMTKLAKEADMNYRSLLNAMKTGMMCEYYLDQIAQELNVPCAYLEGVLNIPDDVDIPGYSVIKFMEPVTTMLQSMDIDDREIDQADKVELLFRLRRTALDWMAENGIG